jgi:hypothetical protein
MGGLAGASGALYERDSSRPGVFPAWEDRRAARGGRPRKQDAKRERSLAAGSPVTVSGETVMASG